MDGIALAAQTFARALAREHETFDAAVDYWTFSGQRLVELLERDVVPQVARLCERVGFQRLALHPFGALLADCRSPEREQIARLKEEIRGCSGVFADFFREHRAFLSELLGRTDVQQALARASAHERIAGDARRETIVIGIEERRSVPASLPYADGTGRQLDLDRLQTYLNAAEADCSQEWASEADYFCPTHGTFLQNGGESLQRGQFIVSLNPALAHVGNSIARCLLVRAEGPVRQLEQLGLDLQRVSVAANAGLAQPWHGPLRELSRVFGDLRQVCLTSDEAELVESAITLVQVYAGLAASPAHLGWLPTSVWPCERIEGLLRHTLIHGRDRETAQRIAWALNKIAGWQNQRAATETALEEAIATGGLVIDEGTQRVYWEGKQIAPKLAESPRQFKLLWCLAHARGVACVGEFDVYGDDNVGTTALASLKEKLCRQLPKSLRDRVAPGSVPKTYRLDLASAQIHLFSPRTSPS